MSRLLGGVDEIPLGGDGDGILVKALRFGVNKCRRLNDPNSKLAQSKTRGLLHLKGLKLTLGAKLPENRERVVVLGSGWGTFYLLKHLDPFKFDVHVISPKKTYYFTPLLNLVATGVLHPAAVTVSIRDCLFRGRGRKVMSFYNASAEDIDPAKNTVTCRELGSSESFDVEYDKLIVSVGAETNTFGIPGAMEHSHFLKTSEDANAIRLRIIDQFEKASLPNKTDEERKRLLSFVVVGGGPAGVETAGALSDMLKSAMRKYYPQVFKHASVHVIEMLPKVLPTFHEGASKFALSALRSNQAQVHLQHRVVKVEDEQIQTVDASQSTVNIPYGFLLWVSGVGAVPFSKKLIERVSGQAGNRIPRVDPSLKIIGSHNIYALGDCSFLTHPKLESQLETLYAEASRCRQGAGLDWLKHNARRLIRDGQFSQLDGSVINLNQLGHEFAATGMSKTDFQNMLRKIDLAAKAPPPTGQFARQAAAFLGTALTGGVSGTVPFIPRHLGDFADVGGGKACLELKLRKGVGQGIIRMNGGLPIFLFRRGFYWYANWSKQNKAAMLIDYMRMGLIGRNIRVDDRKTSVETQLARNL